MGRLVLNVGQNANDGTGDTLRDAMIKVNTNFTEIYGSPGVDGTTISVTGNEIRAVRTNDDLVFSPAGAGAVVFPALTIQGNNIVGTRSNEDINLVPAGKLRTEHRFSTYLGSTTVVPVGMDGAYGLLKINGLKLTPSFRSIAEILNLHGLQLVNRKILPCM